MDQKERQLHHASRAGRIFDEPVEPLQIVLAVEFRRALRHAREHIQRAAETQQQLCARGRAVLRHPLLLLRRAEADERHVRAARADLRGDDVGFRVGKIAVVRTGDLQPGQLLAKVLRRLLRHARLRAEKIDPFPGLRAVREHRRTELNARHTGLERRAEELRAVDDGDAVGPRRSRPPSPPRPRGRSPRSRDSASPHSARPPPQAARSRARPPRS